MTVVQFTRTALNELQGAAEWYEQRNRALSERFLAAATETADRVAANPLAHQIVLDGQVRRAHFRAAGRGRSTTLFSRTSRL